MACIDGRKELLHREEKWRVSFEDSLRNTEMIIRIVQTSYSLGTSISIFITIETLNCILFNDNLDSITI